MVSTQRIIGISHGTTRAMWRRTTDPRFMNRWFAGSVLDIGGGIDGLELAMCFFPRITRVITFDVPDGDAQTLPLIGSDSFDCVYSSHCLEHVNDPESALRRWIDVVRPLGYLVISVPDEDLYEQGIFPSTFNSDHKHTFTMMKNSSWSPVSKNVMDLIMSVKNSVEVEKVELLNHLYLYDTDRFDKCLVSYCESSIEFVLRKRAPSASSQPV